MRVAGITDPELAAKVGTSKQQIFKLRRGERELTPTWARKIGPLLNVSWIDLFDETEGPADRQRMQLLAAFNAMGEENQATLLRVAQGLAPAPSSPEKIHCIQPLRRVANKRSG